MKESGAHAVKLEGGREVKESIERILSAGIPVMGHLGLTPQSIYKFGTYTVRAKEEEEARRLKEDAQMLNDIGCFSIVFEKIPAKLAAEVTRRGGLSHHRDWRRRGVRRPGPRLHDMLGITQVSPRASCVGTETSETKCSAPSVST